MLFGSSQSKFTTCGPVSFSVSSRVRGPIPVKIVCGENSLNRISGRIFIFFSIKQRIQDWLHDNE